jgi:hypothetical protein
VQYVPLMLEELFAALRLLELQIRHRVRAVAELKLERLF